MRVFPRYVTVLKFCELTGYTEDAVKSKRRWSLRNQPHPGRSRPRR